jgi:hypothetical protein
VLQTCVSVYQPWLISCLGSSERNRCSSQKYRKYEMSITSFLLLTYLIKQLNERLYCNALLCTAGIALQTSPGRQSFGQHWWLVSVYNLSPCFNYFLLSMFSIVRLFLRLTIALPFGDYNFCYWRGLKSKLSIQQLDEKPAITMAA